MVSARFGATRSRRLSPSDEVSVPFRIDVDAPEQAALLEDNI